MTPTEEKEFAELVKQRLVDLGVDLTNVWIPPGWYLLLEGFIRAVQQIEPMFSGKDITQAKTKFGNLVIYFNTYNFRTQEFYDKTLFLKCLVNYESKHTCEMCGNLGQQQFNSRKNELTPFSNSRVFCSSCLQEATLFKPSQ